MFGCVRACMYIFLYYNFYYALSAWGGFLKCEQINHVNAFCHRSVKYHITTRLFNFQEMLDQADGSLFQKITCPCNCLHFILPELVNNIHNTRKRVHPYKQITDLYRRSFLPRCLFAYVASITITCICHNDFFLGCNNFYFILSFIIRIYIYIFFLFTLCTAH